MTREKTGIQWTTHRPTSAWPVGATSGWAGSAPARCQVPAKGPARRSNHSGSGQACPSMWATESSIRSGRGRRPCRSQRRRSCPDAADDRRLGNSGAPQARSRARTEYRVDGPTGHARRGRGAGRRGRRRGGARSAQGTARRARCSRSRDRRAPAPRLAARARRGTAPRRHRRGDAHPALTWPPAHLVRPPCSRRDVAHPDPGLAIGPRGQYGSRVTISGTVGAEHERVLRLRAGDRRVPGERHDRRWTTSWVSGVAITSATRSRGPALVVEHPLVGIAHLRVQAAAVGEHVRQRPGRVASPRSERGVDAVGSSVASALGLRVAAARAATRTASSRRSARRSAPAMSMTEVSIGFRAGNGMAYEDPLVARDEDDRGQDAVRGELQGEARDLTISSRAGWPPTRRSAPGGARPQPAIPLLLRRHERGPHRPQVGLQVTVGSDAAVGPGSDLVGDGLEGTATTSSGRPPSSSSPGCLVQRHHHCIRGGDEERGEAVLRGLEDMVVPAGGEPREVAAGGQAAAAYPRSRAGRGALEFVRTRCVDQCSRARCLLPFLRRLRLSGRALGGPIAGSAESVRSSRSPSRDRGCLPGRREWSRRSPPPRTRIGLGRAAPGLAQGLLRTLRGRRRRSRSCRSLPRETPAGERDGTSHPLGEYQVQRRRR